MQKIAVFPGSFDPFTKGHEDIVLRGLSIFDQIIIGIGHNSKKQRYFTIEKTIEGLKHTFASQGDRIKIETYDELTAVFAQKHDAKFLLRGLRNTTDFEYENPIAQANRYVISDLETVFLITSPEYAYISSSIVRELHKYGQDIGKFVPFPL